MGAIDIVMCQCIVVVVMVSVTFVQLRSGLAEKRQKRMRYFNNLLRYVCLMNLLKRGKGHERTRNISE